MKQSVSHYMLPKDREEDIKKIITDLHLDGIENLVYGEEPAKHPVPSLTVGCHLAYWPDWMNFYLGRSNLYKEDFPTEKSLVDYFGGTTVDDWERRIRNNIRAALAEKPAYLVWHVADCTIEETWTRHFHYINKEVLKAAAEVYSAVADVVPPSVYVLFENIFWPGLYKLEPEDVDYFFSRLPGKNVGIMLDTGHLMNTNWDIRTEADGADYVCGVVNRLGSMKNLIRGIHMSCSISGDYQRAHLGPPPAKVTPEIVGHHIISIDQHRPFTTDAAKRIVDTVEPEFLTHELFGPDFSIPVDKVTMQRNAAMGIGSGRMEKER